MPEENNVNFATAEELEELIDGFPEEEICDCDCGGIIIGFDGTMMIYYQSYTILRRNTSNPRVIMKSRNVIYG